MEEDKELLKDKITRFSYWAVLFITLGTVAAFLAPPHSLEFLGNLFKDIIQHLILGA